MPECLHPTGLLALDQWKANSEDTRPLLRNVARTTAEMQQRPAWVVGIEVACLTVRHTNTRTGRKPMSETAEQRMERSH